MKRLLQIISALALLLLLVVPIEYLRGGVDQTGLVIWMQIGTLAWFASAPFWMGKRQDDR